MQLPDRRGISCDLCGMQYRDDFTYYSLDFRPVKFIDGRRPTINEILSQQVMTSLDACTKCMDDIKNIVMKNYAPTNVGVQCDLTGTRMTGSFTCAHCNVIEAKVSISKKRTTTYDRYVELYVKESALEDLKSKAEKVKKAASEWSTSAESK